MFGENGRALARFNMNEYKERHELAKLIGAPPGFVGHEQQAALFRFIDTYPQGLILLDEFEKAHPEIQDYFLQIFDKGDAQDSRGRKVSFRRHIFVMTCNILQEAAQKHKIGFQHATGKNEEKKQIKVVAEKLKRYFRQEFLARIDSVIEFRTLTKKDFQSIMDRSLSTLIIRIEQTHGAHIEITDNIKERICQHCADQDEGARGFIRELNNVFAAPLLDYLRIKPKHHRICIDWIQGKAVFNAICREGVGIAAEQSPPHNSISRREHEFLE